MDCTRSVESTDIIGDACPECLHPLGAHSMGEWSQSYDPSVPPGCRVCRSITEVGEITYTEGGYLNQSAGMVLRALEGGDKKVRLIAMSDGTVRWQ